MGWSTFGAWEQGTWPWFVESGGLSSSLSLQLSNKLLLRSHFCGQEHLLGT